MSLEQVIRDILERAVESGVVALPEGFDDPHPQARTAGELTGPANVLADYLAREDVREDLTLILTDS